MDQKRDCYTGRNDFHNSCRPTTTSGSRKRIDTSNQLDSCSTVSKYLNYFCVVPKL